MNHADPVTLINLFDGYFLSLITLCIILIKIIYDRNYQSNSDKLFLSIIILLIINIINEVLIIIFGDLLRNDYYLPIQIFQHSAYFIHTLIPFLWLIFTTYLMSYKKSTIIKNFIFLSIPFWINFIIVIINPFTNLLFSISCSGKFIKGPLILFDNIISIIYILISLIIYIVKRKNNTKIPYSIIGIHLIIMLISIIFGIFNPNSYIVWQGITLGAVFIYLTIQSMIIRIDHLTQISNRNFFEKKLYDKINYESENFCTLMIDIDNFKYINDTFGHLKGDQIIKDFAQILKNSFTSPAIVSRYGGDEFCIIINCDAYLEAENNLKTNLNRYNKNLNKEIIIEYSLGKVEYNQQDPISSEDFIIQLDQAMYKSKSKKKHNRRQADQEKT